MITSKISSLGLKDGAGTRILVIGAQNTGKTSLAFRLAYESAENGGCPLFICNQAKLESKLPLTVHYTSEHSQMRMSSDILSRIQMKYVTSMNELKAVIAGLHGFTPIPTMLIIDDLSLLIDPLHSVPRGDPKFLEICLSLGAYMDDVLNFLSAKNASSSSNKLQLVVTDCCDEAGFVHMLQKNVHSVAKLVKPSGADHYSLVSISDSRGKRTSSSGGNYVLLAKIEFSEGQLFCE